MDSYKRKCDGEVFKVGKTVSVFHLIPIIRFSGCDPIFEWKEGRVIGEVDKILEFSGRIRICIGKHTFVISDKNKPSDYFDHIKPSRK